ncbi:ATP-binding cassette domain-containing protein [Canibacter sp. lx-45]|uniref:ABC transporter ATP-binding protein n=1 Tax=Canibacter zhuwentaonis TaxID=2837491 RepID=UPI001BDC3ADA|nr:ATP-binding cassette domain-containing protein [Canibacter zhuwentaonis]MBT1035329.1 ATP-binding cassette domain-containing protein [Canibacter zhuwentaonis]
MALEILEVSKRYRLSRKYALRSVSWSSEDGNIIGLTGHNGAGKSTLMGILSGNIKPSYGEVRIDSGQNILRHPNKCRETFAFMTQSYAYLRGVTPQEALMSAAMIRGISRNQARSNIAEYFEALKLDAWAKSPSESLSGGVLRLVSLGMALIQGASYTLLDEPTNDVDPERRSLMWDFLRTQTDKGRTFIVTSHNLDEIDANSSHVLVLNNGELVYSGQTKSLSKLTDNVRFEVVYDTRFIPDYSKNYISEAVGNKVVYIVPRKDIISFLGSIENQMTAGTIHDFNAAFTPRFADIYESLQALNTRELEK